MIIEINLTAVFAGLIGIYSAIALFFFVNMLFNILEDGLNFKDFLIGTLGSILWLPIFIYVLCITGDKK